jgi:hypothetical protein
MFAGLEYNVFEAQNVMMELHNRGMLTVEPPPVHVPGAQRSGRRPVTRTHMVTIAVRVGRTHSHPLALKGRGNCEDAWWRHPLRLPWLLGTLRLVSDSSADDPTGDRAPMYESKPSTGVFSLMRQVAQVQPS